jgi:hypothetical protein
MSQGRKTKKRRGCLHYDWVAFGCLGQALGGIKMRGPAYHLVKEFVKSLINVQWLWLDCYRRAHYR